METFMSNKMRLLIRVISVLLGIILTYLHLSPLPGIAKVFITAVLIFIIWGLIWYVMDIELKNKVEKFLEEPKNDYE